MPATILLLITSFKLLIGGLEYGWDVIGRFLLPEERMAIKILSEDDSRFGWMISDGELLDVSPLEKVFIAPALPGFYTLVISDGKAKKRINIFVMHPFSLLKNGRIGGYLIGRYPKSSPHPNLQRVKGFIEVREEWQDIPISPNYKIKEFLACAPGNTFPKYLTLREELVYKLELLNEKIQEKGYPLSKLKVVSGFRTPRRNYNAGGGRNSAHVYGGAADVIFDENDDRNIDDINRDGRGDSRDSNILSRIAEELDKELESSLPTLVGGVGWYRRRDFIHIDVRGEKERWRR